MSRQNLIAVGALVAIALVIGFIETSKPEQANSVAQEVALDANERTAQKDAQYERAKEITTPDGFINTEPLTISEYIGKKVILVDFWTYSCINCQRTLPYLTSWDEKYRDDGLLIVGVHTPEFEFEKMYDNVVRATEKWGVAYPVVLDNDYSTWRAYRNQYWPRKYLIDIDGYIVYDHIGEGGYDETEKKIVELLNERKQALGESGSVVMKGGEPSDVDSVDTRQTITRETYLGSARIEFIRNLTRMSCLEDSCTYTFTNTSTLQGYELSGNWKHEPENVTLESSTGALRIGFMANKVNLVAGSDTSVKARILIDGKEVNGANAGSAVENGIVTFNEHDLYNLVDLKGEYGSHILEIQFLDSGISAFAFTFG